MTPSDDEVLAAVRANVPEHCFMWDADNKLIDAFGLDRDEMLALYRHAYAAGQRAGMEKAAGICEARAKTYGLYSDDVSLNRSLGSEFCADAIRAAAKGVCDGLHQTRRDHRHQLERQSH